MMARQKIGYDKPQSLNSSESKVIWTALYIGASVDSYLPENKFLNLVSFCAQHASKRSQQRYF